MKHFNTIIDVMCIFIMMFLAYASVKHIESPQPVPKAKVECARLDNI